MDQDHIEKWRGELESFRQKLGNIHYTELIKFAESLGRSKRKASTKHPMYESCLTGRRALSIPGHKGCLSKGTARSILDVLEGDIDAHEIQHRQEVSGGAQHGQ